MTSYSVVSNPILTTTEDQTTGDQICVMNYVTYAVSTAREEGWREVEREEREGVRERGIGREGERERGRDIYRRGGNNTDNHVSPTTSWHKYEHTLTNWASTCRSKLNLCK